MMEHCWKMYFLAKSVKGLVWVTNRILTAGLVLDLSISASRIVEVCLTLGICPFLRLVLLGCV